MSKQTAQEKLIVLVGAVPDTFKGLEKEGFRIHRIDEPDDLLDRLGQNNEALIIVEGGPQQRNLSKVLSNLKEADHNNPVMVLMEERARKEYSGDPDYHGTVHPYDRDEEESILVQGALRSIVRNAVMTENE